MTQAEWRWDEGKKNLPRNRKLKGIKTARDGAGELDGGLAKGRLPRPGLQERGACRASEPLCHSPQRGEAGAWSTKASHGDLRAHCTGPRLGEHPDQLSRES